MLDLTLDQNRYGLVHLVACHSPGQGTFQLGIDCCFSIAHFWAPFSVNTVFTRAISRRTLRNSLVLVICCVATCIRKPNCALVNDSSSVCKSAADLALSSAVLCLLAFMLR